MKFNYQSRIRLISFGIFIFALVIIVRLYFLQIVDNDFYINKDGSLVSAATLKSGYIVAVNPEILKDPEFAYQKLNEIIPIDRDLFITKATKLNDPYEEIVIRADEEIGQKISNLKITGLQVFGDHWRFYPGGNIASHIIGILGYKGDEYAGRYGLERQFETELKREEGAF